MKKKRTLQNNLSYSLKYIFDNYGLSIFGDSEKLFFNLSNLIPSLTGELDIVKLAIEKNALEPLVNASTKREVDHDFAYIRSKAILIKNGVSEKAALYVVDCFSYALGWIDEIPEFDDLKDSDFEIKVPKESKKLYIKKDSLEKVKLDTEKSTDIDLKPTVEEKSIEIESEKVADDENFEDFSINFFIDEDKLETEIKDIPNNKEEAIEVKQEDIPKKEVTEIKQNISENKNKDKKYYLSHDFDDDDDDYYDYDDDDYDDDYVPLYKRLIFIILPLILVLCLGFFLFKNFTKEAEPVVSGISITTEYKMDSGRFVLPLNKETDLNVLIQSNNSKKIELSKLRCEIEDSSLCTFENKEKKCTITGLKEGTTNLLIYYNDELIDSISIEFLDFLKIEQENLKAQQEQERLEQERLEAERLEQERLEAENNYTEEQQPNYNRNPGRNDNNGGGNTGGNNNNGGGGNTGGNDNNGGGGNTGGNDNNGGGGNTDNNNNGGGGNADNNNNGDSDNTDDNDNGSGDNTDNSDNTGGSDNTGNGDSNEGSGENVDSGSAE